MAPINKLELRGPFFLHPLAAEIVTRIAQGSGRKKKEAIAQKAPSHFQIRFGMIAVKRRFITADQLVEATTIQLREDAEGKPHRFIGEILADLGYMTPSQIQAVLWKIADGSG